jgi:hypothetical protein
MLMLIQSSKVPKFQSAKVGLLPGQFRNPQSAFRILQITALPTTPPPLANYLPCFYRNLPPCRSPSLPARSAS